MSNRVPMEGLKFGLLLVKKFSHVNHHRLAEWVCKCDCGNTVIMVGANLRSGNTQSCGCRRQDSIAREQNTYKEARRRCTNQKNKDYKYYGGRGIEWRFRSFKEFIAHLGPRPSPNHSIERKDVNGHYEIGNVIWGTGHQQCQNRRKTYAKQK